MSMKEIVELQALADEYGKANAEIDVIMKNPVFKRAEELKRRILLLADSVTPKDSPDDFYGSKYVIHVTPKKKTTEWKPGAMRTIFDKVGVAAFCEAVSLTLKSAGDIITKKEIERLTTSDNTGARTLTVKDNE